MALYEIEKHVRGEFDYEGPLPIPLEWEHRVPSEPEMSVGEALALAYGGTPEVIEMSPGAFMEIVEEPTTINYSPAEEPDNVTAHLMKEAFNAEYDGDEAEAQKRIDEFWRQ